MNYVKLDESQEENLVKILSNMVRYASKTNDIECIYITPLNGQFYTSDRGKVEDSILKVTIIMKELIKEYQSNINNYNNNKNTLNDLKKYGFKLYLELNKTENYNLLDENIDGQISLFNSTILYDKSGKYKKLKSKIKKDEFNKKNKVKYKNLAIIKPSIDKKIKSE